MLRGLRVPNHRVDAPGVYILPHDDAWNHERVAAELAELVELALRKAKDEAIEVFARQHRKGADELTPEERETAAGSVVLTEVEAEAARDRHPWRRYTNGETRFDLAALDQGPRGQVLITEYFKDGVHPTEFHLRRVGFERRARLDPYLERDPVRRWAGWLRAGIERITCGGEVLWSASAEQPELPDAWIERLCDAAGGAAMNLIYIAGACSKYSAPLKPDEKKA